jgi:hypothetical protein
MLGVDVDQHRRRAGPYHGLGGRDERVGRQDHLVTHADPERAQGYLERVRAVRDAHAVRRPHEAGVRLLEPRHGLALDERRLAQHLREPGGDLLGDLPVLRLQVDQRNGDHDPPLDHRRRILTTDSRAIGCRVLPIRRGRRSHPVTLRGRTMRLP